VVGTPVMAPVESSSVNPLGSEPAVRDHDSGAVPPLAASVVE
jgi:hypothetical protein